jgi:hypothetical protein
MRTLTVDPLIPGTLWALLAVTVAAAILVYLTVHPPRVSRTRRAAIGAFLALGAAGLLVVLLNPTWERVRKAAPTRPPLAILVDTSASMAVEDQDGRTRLEAALRMAGRLREGLEKAFEVSLWTFDRDLKAPAAGAVASLSPDGIVTDLGGGVQRALTSAVGDEGALVVLSDGIHNAGDVSSAVGAAACAARAMAVPVFTRTVGSSAAVEDLDVVVTTPENLGFVNQRVTVAALLRHSGVEGTADVTLTHDGEVLETRTVRLPPDGPAQVAFQVACEAPGLSRYVVRAAPTAGEIVRSNNEGVSYLRVIDEPIHVLVLEGKPYWDFKFLMRRLAKDASLCLKGAVRIRQDRVLVRDIVKTGEGKDGEPIFDEKVEQLTHGDAMLASEDCLKGCHILILGRDVEAFLSPDALDAVARWVSNDGGCVVCSRGKPVQMVSERLDALMPVRWQKASENRFRIHLTQDAQWAGWLPVRAPLMPSLATDTAVEEVKPLATVLARADPAGPLEGMPVITMQHYGAGRVLVIGGSGLWRWAMAEAGAADQSGQAYQDFWSSLLRWLAGSADFPPGSTAALRPLQRQFTTLERPALQLLARADSPLSGRAGVQVEIAAGEDGRRVAQARALPSATDVGLFDLSVDPLPAGWYRARVVGAPDAGTVECAFDVIEPRQEKLELRARPDVMRFLAEGSGGKVLTQDGGGEILDAYFEQWRTRHPEQFEREPAWDRWPWLLALAALLGGAWVVRRRGGLV